MRIARGGRRARGTRAHRGELSAIVASINSTTRYRCGAYARSQAQNRSWCIPHGQPLPVGSDMHIPPWRFLAPSGTQQLVPPPQQ